MLVTYLNIVKFKNPLHFFFKFIISLFAHGRNLFSASETIIIDIIGEKKHNKTKG